MASAGQDMQNVVLQAKEFGLGRNGQQTLIATAAFVTDVHALGLAVAQGLRVPASFYWDMNDQSRAWSEEVLRAGQANADDAAGGELLRDLTLPRRRPRGLARRTDCK